MKAEHHVFCMLAATFALGACGTDIAEFWSGGAHFEFVSKSRFPGPDGHFGMNVGFHIVPRQGRSAVWYLFHREYGFGPRPTYCKYDWARIVVRNSTDEGRSWSASTVLASPVEGGPAECALVDGGAFWDEAQAQWHYLSQCLNRHQVWSLCHYTNAGPDPAQGAWQPTFDTAGAPSVASGQLWRRICGRAGAHCTNATGSEGTPEIVRKDEHGRFYVTFHGWDPTALRSARGVASTADFVHWSVDGDELPGDAIMSRIDCMQWASNNFSWHAGGCVGGGEGTILISRVDGRMYHLIEAADRTLGCLTKKGEQNWVLGLSRAATFLRSGQWEPFRESPTVVPAVTQGCYIQYHRLFFDVARNNTYLEFWADEWMQVWALRPGRGTLPIVAGPPPKT